MCIRDSVIAEGRLVNIAAADGHPAEIMDLSFAVQAMSAAYIRDHHKELGSKVINVSKEMDEAIALSLIHILMDLARSLADLIEAKFM